MMERLLPFLAVGAIAVGGALAKGRGSPIRRRGPQAETPPEPDFGSGTWIRMGFVHDKEITNLYVLFPDTLPRHLYASTYTLIHQVTERHPDGKIRLVEAIRSRGHGSRIGLFDRAIRHPSDAATDIVYVTVATGGPVIVFHGIYRGPERSFQGWDSVEPAIREAGLEAVLWSADWSRDKVLEMAQDWPLPASFSTEARMVAGLMTTDQVDLVP